MSKTENNILVIDNSNSALKERIAFALTRAGFEVTTDTSFDKALSQLGKPELIILGEGLSLDSFEACYQLRQVVNARILMVGSGSNDETWARAVVAGADFYLLKPLAI